MENVFEDENYAKNIYVIKHKLADLKKYPHSLYYEWKIGMYTLHIYTHRMRETPAGPEDFITKHKEVDINLYEDTTINDKVYEKRIDIRSDSRFKNYKPIMYNVIETPNGIINQSDGREMPILRLCELIRYLHRLANLTLFL